MEPDELTDEQERELHGLLLESKAELEASLADCGRAETVDLELPIGRVSRIDAIQQQAMAQAERRRAEQALEQVSAALEFMDEGSYGYCKRCEEPIGYRRLKARPSSPFCIPCLQGVER